MQPMMTKSAVVQLPMPRQQLQSYCSVPQQPVVHAPSVPMPQQRFPPPIHFQQRQQQQQQSCASLVVNPTHQSHQIIHVQHESPHAVGGMPNSSSMLEPATCNASYGNQVEPFAPSYHRYQQQQPLFVSYITPTASQQQMTQSPPSMYTTMPSAQPVEVWKPPSVLMTQHYLPPPPPKNVSQQLFIALPDPHQPRPNAGKLHLKVLEIINPKTLEVINKQDVERSRHSFGGYVRAAATQPDSPIQQQVDVPPSEAIEEQTTEVVELAEAPGFQQPLSDDVEEIPSSPFIEVAADLVKAVEPKPETKTEVICSSLLTSLEDGEYCRDENDCSISEDLLTKPKANLEDLAEKLAELKKNSTMADVKNRRYSRVFLLNVGRIVSERNEPKCPTLMMQLTNFGIDYESNGHLRTVAQKTPQQKKLKVVLDQSQAPMKEIKRITKTLHQAPQPWKPKRRTTEEADSNANDAEKKALYKNVRSMLNKVTPSTFDALCNDFMQLELHNKSQYLDTVIDIIFDKAVEEPKYTALYIKLLEKQIDQEIRSIGAKSVFRNGILNKCQTTFETAQKNRDEKLANKRVEANAEPDEKKHAELLLKCKEEEEKERRRLFGLISFIGHLYCSHLLTPNIMQWCINYLLKQHMSAVDDDEECIECVIKMLTTIGKDLDNDARGNNERQRNVECYYDSLQSFDKLSIRVRFSIDDLIELRANKWVARKSVAEKPTTIKEVHQQVDDERRQNEIERKEHSLQTKRWQNRNGVHQRPGDGGVGHPARSGSPQRGRGDQRVNRPLRADVVPSTFDRRMHAAAASNSVPQTAPSKNHSMLKKLQNDGQVQDHGKKAWANGAQGGGGSQQDADGASSSSSRPSQLSLCNGQ